MNRNLQLLKAKRYTSFYVDVDTGEYWQELRPPEKFKPSPNCPDCQVLCGHILHRPHIGYPKCRVRLARVGKLPRWIRVQPYTAWIHKDRARAKAKEIVLSLLLPLIETFLMS